MLHLLRKIQLTCFHLLLLVTPLLFTWFNDELFEFNKMLFVYTLALVIGTTWLLQGIVKKSFQVKHSSFSILVLIFLSSQILSTIFSIHIPTSLFGYYSRLNGGLFSIIAYATIFFVAFQEIGVPQLKKLALSLTLGGLAAAVFALPEHFGHAWSCVLIRQEFTTGCWIQDVQARIFGSFGQPNWLAAYAITLIPVLLSLLPVANIHYLQKKISLEQVGLLLTTSALFTTLIFTKSRSGWLGLAMGLLLFVIGLIIIWYRQHASVTQIITSPTFKWIGMSFLLFMLLMAVFGTPLFSGLEQTVLGSTQTDAAPVPVDRLEQGGTDSGEIRKIVWEGALKVWLRYPLLGSGVETFAYSYYQDRPLAHNTVSEWDFLYNKAHNELLNYLATTGIVGTISYVLLLGWWAWLSIRVVFDRTKYTWQQKTIVLGLCAGIASLTVSNLLGFSTVMVAVLFFLYPAAALIILSDKREKPEKVLRISWKKVKDTTLTLKDYALIGIVLIASLYLVLQVALTWLADYTYTQGKDAVRLGQTNQGIRLLESAAALRPAQPVFSDTISSLYSQLAVGYAQLEATDSAALAASKAIDASNQTLLLNPVHTIFYKSRIKVFSTLAQVYPELLEQAQQTAEVALTLSPTDPKLWYQLGMVKIANGQTEAGIQDLQQSVSLRPEYEQAQMHLAQFLATQGRLLEAKEHYEYVLQYLSPQNAEARESLGIIEASLSSQVKQ